MKRIIVKAVWSSTTDWQTDGEDLMISKELLPRAKELFPKAEVVVIGNYLPEDFYGFTDDEDVIRERGEAS